MTIKANSPIPIELLQKKIKERFSEGDIVLLPNNEKGRPPFNGRLVKIYPCFVRFQDVNTGLYTCVHLFDMLNLKAIGKEYEDNSEEEKVIATAMSQKRAVSD